MFTVRVYGYDQYLLSGYMGMTNVYSRVYGYDQCLLSVYTDMTNVYCQGICI